MMRDDEFRIVGEIRQIETIAIRGSIRVLRRLRRRYGGRRWRKLKGIAVVQLADASLAVAEVHWYEAHGVGNRHIKIKTFLG
jgi:hypothetical protein